jgi:negative regulator of sigma-B (phosphoserine phosphatase)
MASVITAGLSALRYGTAASTLPGNARSGDLEVVHLHAGGALLALVDGLGHGESAAIAAERARLTIQSHLQDPVATILQRCHEELRFTRGVVMSVAAIDFERGLLTWLGVGNVRGVLYRAEDAAQPRREELLLRSGVVGAHLPALRATETPVGLGDTLILATDGVRSDFADTLTPSAEPRALAPWILAQYGRPTDDALVLVARLT